MGIGDVLARMFGIRKPGAELEPHNGSWTIGRPDSRHPFQVGPDHPLAELLVGMEFHATFQTRTPLRILRRNGQVIPLDQPLPSDFAPWMGMWVPKARTWREIGVDRDEVDDDPVVASQAGPVPVSSILPFLIAVREAVEDESGGTANRVERLRAVCRRPEFTSFVSSHGGEENMCDHLFPPVLSMISGLSSAAKAELEELGLASVEALESASDDTLLAVSGVGPAKLRAIRRYCLGYVGDPKAVRLVNLEE